MKSILIPILFVINFALELSATGFEKVFLTSQNSPDQEYCYKTIRYSTNRLVSIGYNDGFSFSPTNYYIRFSDNDGNEVWTKIFAPGSEPVNPDICISTDNSIVAFIMDRYDSLGYYIYKVDFIRLDTLGNSITSKHYDFTYNPHPAYGYWPRLHALNDSGFVFTTGQDLIKLNSALDTIIHKTYKYGITLSEINHGQSEIFIVRKDTINGSDTTFITAYDTQLDSIYSTGFSTSIYNYVKSFGWSMRRLHIDPFGNFYFNSHKFSNPDSITFIKLDNNLNLVWQKFLVDSGIRSNDFDVDSSRVIFTGGYPTVTTIETGFLYILNLTGDSSYFHSFNALQGAYNETNPYNIFISGNEYILSGWVNSDTSVQKSYMARVDTLYNFPVSVNDISKENTLQIYPNPCTDYLKINGAGLIYPLRISVYDFTAKKLFNNEINSIKEKIDLSSLSPGIYIVEVSSKYQRQRQIIIKQ
jgi:hypothetical protein